MSPELIVAIRERIAAGHTKEQIRSEVVGIGYSENVFEEAYQVASEEDVTVEDLNSLVTTTKPKSPLFPSGGSGSVSELISYGDFMSATWNLARQQFTLFLKIVGLNILIVAIVFAGGFFAFGNLYFTNTAENGVYFVFLMLGAFTLVVFWMLSSLVLIRSLLKRDNYESLMSHFIWSVRHSVGLVVTSLAMVAIIMLGYLLFIIPGLILIVYLFFALFFYLDERAYGIKSLVLSVKYSYGRFWSLVGRIILLSIAVYLVAFITGMLSVFTLILAPIFIVIAVLFSYYLTYCGYVVLYESILKAGVLKPLPVSDTTLDTTFKWITGIILMFILGLLILSASSIF